MAKQRLDVVMAERGLAESRQRMVAIIARLVSMTGAKVVSEVPTIKPVSRQ